MDLLKAYIVPEDDKKWIESGKDEDEKLLRAHVVRSALDLNGAVSVCDPGVAVSYIPADNFYVRVDIQDAEKRMIMILENALNWAALGKGKGGLAGAAVRWKLRGLFSADRESRTVSIMEPSYNALIKEYSEFLNLNQLIFGIWHNNAWNVVGIATGCFIKEGHHWDAANTRPQKALLGSLGQMEAIGDAEIRKLFYLSIHPLPLPVLALAYTKANDNQDKDISDTVKMRLKVAPAGFADVCACGVAIDAFLQEDYSGKLKILDDVMNLKAASEEIRNYPLNYHPMAALMGLQRFEYNKAAAHEAMVVLSAYIKVNIQGTLARSAALGKFIDANQRRVLLFQNAFDAWNKRKTEDLLSMLTGEKTIDLDDAVSEIKPIAKVISNLRDLQDQRQPVEALDNAVTLVSRKLTNVIERIDARPNARAGTYVPKLGYFDYSTRTPYADNLQKYLINSDLDLFTTQKLATNVLDKSVRVSVLNERIGGYISAPAKDQPTTVDT